MECTKVPYTTLNPTPCSTIHHPKYTQTLDHQKPQTLEHPKPQTLIHNLCTDCKNGILGDCEVKANGDIIKDGVVLIGPRTHPPPQKGSVPAYVVAICVIIGVCVA